MTLSHPASTKVEQLAEQAAAALAAASATEKDFGRPGAREEFRESLKRAIDSAGEALAASLDPNTTVAMHRLLVQAHAAWAEDARHGAGALARGSQRAPTLEDTEDGWERVEEIALGAETSASEAERSALVLGEPRCSELARRARGAAQAARQIVLDRNRAYTFQTLPGLSFGEGWYLCAAAVLAGVHIQISPGSPEEPRARRFLLDAGLTEQVVPYRPRPASPKHLTALIAAAFRKGPAAAQLTLRGSFLGAEPPPPELVEWIDGVAGVASAQKVLLWVRTGNHHPHRNTDFGEFVAIARLVSEAGLVPVYFGDAIPSHVVLPPGLDLTLCWKSALLQTVDMRRRQLQLFERLRSHHGLLGQIGVTTAGMDGPALLGLPTRYLTDEPNVRLGKWVGAVPDYVEVARGPNALGVLRAPLEGWKQR